eukprot:scaffold298786_cov17-Tisochrysis_lutea.AAC.1
MAHPCSISKKDTACMCWAAAATLRSQQRHRSHAHQSYSDGECGNSSSSAACCSRNHTALTADLSPRHAGYAAAQGRIAEGLALLGVPLALDSVPYPRPGRHRSSRYPQGLSHSYSFAPDWGTVARAGGYLGDPWQQQRMMERHALK